MRPRLQRLARRAASAPGVPPEEREALREELLDHLADSAANYRSLGCSPSEAERLAARDFGDHRKARDDLSRAWRGKRTVLFPDQPGERLAHFRVYDLKAVLIIVALVVVLRWQVVAAYHIPTKSMEPTLHGDPADGDKILVNKLYYRFSAPERWQLAVFERDGDDRNLIKRIAGLSGESLDIRNGDLFIDGEIARKPRSVQDDMLVPVFGENRDLLPGAGKDRSGLQAWTRTGTWSETAGGFVAVADEQNQALLGWTRRVPDAYPGGDRGRSGSSVGDLVLQFDVVPGEGAESVGAVLREGQNVFEVVIPVGGGDAVLTNEKVEIGRAPGVGIPRGEKATLRLANLDDRVTVELSGTEILGADVPDREREGESGAAVAEFGLKGGTATFTHVRLSRDIYYHREGRLPVEIPEGRYFMLGDNSGNSADSREWGTVSRAQLIGRPLMVFWPPSRAKVLH